MKLLNYDGSTWLDKENKEWHQTNDGDKSYGQVTLRKAMQHSVNTPFIQLGVDVGTDKVKETALEAGLVEDQLAATVPSFSLGTSSPAPSGSRARTPPSPPRASRSPRGR